jgi:hypothetical protein
MKRRRDYRDRGALLEFGEGRIIVAAIVGAFILAWHGLEKLLQWLAI